MSPRVRFGLVLLGATGLLLLSIMLALLSFLLWLGNGLEMNPDMDDPWIWVAPAVVSLGSFVLFGWLVLRIRTGRGSDR